MAAMAAAKNLAVTIIERAELGGTCLNRGCIPTKALCRNAEVLTGVRHASQWGISIDNANFDLDAAMTRKDNVVTQLREGVGILLNQPLIEVVQGEAVLKDAHTVSVAGKDYQARNIVIATGSAPRNLPIEGADLCISSDQALQLREVPKRLCIIGGGVIGMEFAGIYSAFGAEVTVVEFCKEILPPFDKDIAKRLRTTLTRQGMKINVAAAAQSITRNDDGSFTVAYESKGKTQTVDADVVLMAVGRKPVLPQGLETVGVAVGKQGIVTDDHMRTNVPGIYAIGDVNGRCMLAHAATAHGAIALSDMLGETDSHIRLDVMPSAVFTTPELAMVGLTEEQAKEQALDISVKKAFFRSNGKAVAMDEPEGLIKLIVENGSRRIIGCHICGAHAADIIHEVVVAMNADASVDTLARSIHAHPTLSEVLHSATLA